MNQNQSKFTDTSTEENDYMEFINDIAEESDLEFQSKEEETIQKQEDSSFTNYDNEFNVNVDDI